MKQICVGCVDNIGLVTAACFAERRNRVIILTEIADICEALGFAYRGVVCGFTKG